MTSSSKPSAGPVSKSGFKPIRTLVAENETFAPMLQRLEFISRLQKIYSNTVTPALNEMSRVAAVEGSTIVVAAINGHAASILKQMLPRLLQKFRENQKQEQEVTAIRVIVQPTVTGVNIEPQTRNSATKMGAPMPQTAIDCLANSLGDSPLKDTIIRIQQKRERALTINKKP
mgnify:CR=1 FL=1